MAMVCIAQPVPETRELLGHLLRRLGHTALAPGELHCADALVFESTSAECVALAHSVARRHAHTALVACSAFPVDAATLPPRAIPLTQPFSPDDLARALSGALAAAV
jgi:hypothetical protein